MPTLSKRIWTLPNGEDWITWRVEWKENGHPRRKPFNNFRDAVVFLAELGKELKARRAFARSPVREDRVVRPRAGGAQIIPIRHRR